MTNEREPASEESFSERLNAFLDQAGWPTGHGRQVELAKKYGKSPSTVHRWLHKNVVPERTVLVKLAAQCQTTPGVLQYGEAVAGQAMPALVSSKMLLDIVEVAASRKIPFENIKADALERLWKHLHGHWGRYGRVDIEDIEAAFDLMNVGKS